MDSSLADVLLDVTFMCTGPANFQGGVEHVLTDSVLDIYEGLRERQKRFSPGDRKGVGRSFENSLCVNSPWIMEG